MHLYRIDPAGDREAVRALYGIHRAAEAAETPEGPILPAPSFCDWAAHGWSDEPREVWLGDSDGDGDRGTGPAAGGYVLELPDTGTHRVASLLLVVHPEARSCGAGRRLFEHARARMRAAGATSCTAMVLNGSPGEALARSTGAKPSLVFLRQVCALDRAKAPRPGEVTAAAGVPGYSPVRWCGRTPRGYESDVAALTTATSDAPSGDVDRDGVPWSVQRVRTRDERCAARGTRAYSVAAFCESEGRLVALSTAYVDAAHEGWASQGDTVVLGEHRGRRLSLGVKKDLMTWLREKEPSVHSIATWNAEPNDGIRRVNGSLGFTVSRRWTEWHLVL
ncbi:MULTISPECIES: GNAT family N-acetyltransferase [unclassified Streptomyces]|uniref:GNAT family N-acetyltransferase n=1 Tax=unclassified Streptomyces TaxID=2593676 RepID=UPI000938A34A|nr:GNAT family N-acetyltransferase [Streptomyces sp. TSRI0281]OKI40717.1 hypothetical protein A6A29_38650 [Streptomyces sp. TSRI0281]